MSQVQHPETLKSKKFLFATLVELTWKALLFYAIHEKVGEITLQAMIIAAAVAQGIYLGGQSFIDAAVRVAQHKFAAVVPVKPPAVEVQG